MSMVTFPLYEMLWPVFRELARWRLLTFYEMDTRAMVAAVGMARVKILSAGEDGGVAAGAEGEV